MYDLISWYPCQHLLVSLFFISVILFGVQWYPIVGFLSLLWVWVCGSEELSDQLEVWCQCLDPHWGSWGFVHHCLCTISANISTAEKENNFIFIMKLVFTSQTPWKFMSCRHLGFFRPHFENQGTTSYCVGEPKKWRNKKTNTNKNKNTCAGGSFLLIQCLYKY